MNDDNHRDMLTHALEYFDKWQWAIHPLRPNEKIPVTTEWNKYSHELPTREQIIEWWQENPNYNIGLVTGEASKVVVLDVDLQTNPNAATQLEALAYGDTKKRIVAPYVWTPGGGKHVYFAYPEGANIGCTSTGIKGIDTRGNGGNIVLPPSIHPNGKRYRWNAPLEDRDLPPLPDAIVAKLDKDRPAPKKVKVDTKLNPNSLLSTMMERCAFCREFTPDTGNILEELWYRWLTQMVCFDGGAELAYELSSGSEKFKDKETAKKIAHADEARVKGLAPYKCSEIIGCEGWSSPECQSCIAHPSRRDASPAGLPYILQGLAREKKRAGIEDDENIDIDEIEAEPIPDEVVDAAAEEVEQPTAYVYEPIDTSEIDLTPSTPIPALPETVWRGIFAKYRELMSPASEAPDAYHFGNLLTCAGASMGRSVMIDYAGELYPNFYTVLEGPTGISRKSSATKRAVQTIHDVDKTLIIRRGLSTIEGMINLLRAPTEEEMDEYTDKLTAFNKGLLTPEPEKPTPIFEHEGRRLLIILDEFTHLLKKARQESSSTLIHGLTNAYDMPETLDNPTKENPMSAHKPCVSVIGLTTKAWLEHALNYEDLLGGFVNRFIFFAGEPKDPIPLPPKPDKDLWDRIGIHLQSSRFANHRISEKQRSSHEYHLLPEATELWDGYYRKWHKRQRECENEMMTALYQRLPNHAMKMALVYACLEHKEGDGVITPDQIQASIDFADYAEKSYEYLFHGFGFSQRSRVEATIEDRLRRKQMTRRELRHAISSATSSREINDAILDMIRIGKVGDLSLREKGADGKTYPKKVLALLK